MHDYLFKDSKIKQTNEQANNNNYKKNEMTYDGERDMHEQSIFMVKDYFLFHLSVFSSSPYYIMSTYFLFTIMENVLNIWVFIKCIQHVHEFFPRRDTFLVFNCFINILHGSGMVYKFNNGWIYICFY